MNFSRPSKYFVMIKKKTKQNKTKNIVLIYSICLLYFTLYVICEFLRQFALGCSLFFKKIKKLKKLKNKQILCWFTQSLYCTWCHLWVPETICIIILHKKRKTIKIIDITHQTCSSLVWGIVALKSTMAQDVHVVIRRCRISEMHILIHLFNNLFWLGWGL